MSEYYYNPEREAEEKKERQLEITKKWSSRGHNLATLFLYGAALGLGSHEASAQEKHHPDPQSIFATLEHHKEKAKELEAEEKKLTERIGASNFLQLKSLESIKKPKERTERIAETVPVTLHNFELANNPAIFSDKEPADQVVSEAYAYLPKSFRSKTQQVTSVDYVPHEYAPSGNTYLKEGTRIGAIFEPTENKIKIFPGLIEAPSTLLEFDVFHEFGHRNAAESNKLMTLPERELLLETVIARLDDEDRNKSYDVGLIQGDDPQMVTWRKAQEYWAEIFAMYLQHKTLLPQKDRDIVRSVLELMDADPDAYPDQQSPVQVRKNLHVTGNKQQ